MAVVKLICVFFLGFHWSSANGVSNLTFPFIPETSKFPSIPDANIHSSKSISPKDSKIINSDPEFPEVLKLTEFQRIPDTDDNLPAAPANSSAAKPKNAHNVVSNFNKMVNSESQYSVISNEFRQSPGIGGDLKTLLADSRVLEENEFRQIPEADDNVPAAPADPNTAKRKTHGRPSASNINGDSPAAQADSKILDSDPELPVMLEENEFQPIPAIDGDTPASPADSSTTKQKAYVQPFAGKISSYSGFLTVNQTYKSNLFFWLIESESNSRKNDDLILWLQGGPGQSSLLAAFAENGPYELTDGKVMLRDHSWTQYYNMLYLDNPVGAGYSYTRKPKGFPKTIAEAVADVRTALLKFYDMFPEYKENDLYIAGEDYGGKYIPPLARLIHVENEKLSKGKFKIPLKGIMIGGGLLDPQNQLHFSQYFYHAGILDNQGRDRVIDKENEMKSAIKNNDHIQAKSHRKSIEGELLSAGYSPPLSMLDPSYDTSTYEEVKKFLKRKDIRKQLHAGPSQFKNGRKVAENFKNDIFSSVGDDLSTVLNYDKYRVLLYTGQCDLVVPATQMDSVIKNLSWGGLKAFEEADRNELKVDDVVAGYVKQYTYLTQIMVRKANHLIARSQPKWTLSFINYFTGRA